LLAVPLLMLRVDMVIHGCIPDAAAVSFPIKSADEFDISMTYLLLSARKMFAKMSENLNFIYYSAPSRATGSWDTPSSLAPSPA